MTKSIRKNIMIILLLAFTFAFAASSVFSSGICAYAASKTPSKVVMTSVKAISSGAICLKWKSVSSADKYQIYRAASKTGTFKFIKSVTTKSYTDKGLISGKRYYYKVRAVNDSKKGSFSEKKYADTKLKKATISSIKSTSKGYVKLSWKKVTRSQKYQIYRSTSANGEYKKIYTTKALSYTDKSVKTGKKYYYKVRAYRQNYSTGVYGYFSKANLCKTPTKLTLIRQNMLTQVNKERKEAGKDPLKLYAPINTTSQTKAKDMYKLGVLDHYSQNLGYMYDQFDKANITWYACGENIAWGQQDVTSVMDSWMNSSGHKRNILSSDYTHLGVGYYKGYWVQQFIGK